MSHHDFSLSGIPTIAYLGSTIPDGSADINAASVRDITLNFDQSVDKLSAYNAEQLGIAIPTLTVTATPKGGDTQTLVEGTDFHINSNMLFLFKEVILRTNATDLFVDAFGFDGLTKDNVFDYFTNGSYFRASVLKPDTTYTITYSPNYFWNKSTGILYDKEISITFKTRPVQATATLTFKKDMAQELANNREDGIASLVELNAGCEIRYPSHYCPLTRRRTDATRALYDYAVGRFFKYHVLNLSRWDSLESANWYANISDEMKSDTAVVSRTTYAASSVCSDNGWTYHYYDIHLEVW